MYTPCPRLGRPYPGTGSWLRAHEHDCSARVFFFAYPSFSLIEVLTARAEYAMQPKMIRVDFILSNLIVFYRASLLYLYCY